MSPAPSRAAPPPRFRPPHPARIARKTRFALLALAALSPAGGALASPTLTVVAYDSTSAEWGAAVLSGLIASGGLIPEARAGAGVVVGQGVPDPPLCLRGVDSLAAGRPAASALAGLWAGSTDRERQQMAAIDAAGRADAVTGTHCMPRAAHRLGAGCAALGVGLRSERTLDAAMAALRSSPAALAERLLAALEAAGQTLGEDDRPRSAALLVVRENGGVQGKGDRFVDLRVDDSAGPLAELARLYGLHSMTYLPAAHARFGDEARRSGRAESAEREYALAETGFRAAVARSPRDADALNELAWFLATHDRSPADAVRFGEAAVLARPDDPNLWDTLAEAHLRAGSIERAIDASERAVRLSGSGAPAYEVRLARLKSARTALRARADSTAAPPAPTR